MQRYTRSFLGGLVGLTLVGAACSSDPGIKSVTGGGGSTGGSGAGGTSGGGRGGTTGGGGRAGTAGGAGAGGAPNFTFNVPDGGSGDAVLGAGADKACGFQKYELERLPPELLLVLDRSRTMGDPVQGSNNSRWVEVTAAIDEVLVKTEATVMWGLKLFPTMSGCMVGDPMEVGVAANSYAMMSASMRGTMPNTGPSGTPMQLGLRKGTTHLLGRNNKNPKYMVLGTDGLPNCMNNQSGSRDTVGTVQAIKDAAGMGIKTFVVGIATHSEGAAAHMGLNEMAVAGGEARMDDAKYYPVSNKADLVTVLNNIAVRVSNCVFPLDKEPPSPEDVAVNIGGKRVPRDQWKYGANNKSIEVLGPICDELKSGKAMDVDIIFGCPNVPIP